MVVRVVVLFGGSAFARVKGGWPEDPETVVLVEDAGDREPACIRL